MNKDVIYIDVDDDVTAVIGKIKKAKEKIVAIVPPKRAGTLQSAVNLRLLERMAKNDSKQLVLITNNAALIALAANARIPVAKNLQSKPELAEIAAVIVDDGDDLIDGSELPVGDHAKTVKVKDGTKVAPLVTRNEDIDTTDLDIDGESIAAAAVPTVAATNAARVAVKKGKNRPKIPNFDSFRKKLFFGIAGGFGLVALLIWMFVFAPAATVIITASTSPTPITASVQLGGTAATDYDTGIISSVSQLEQKDAKVEFEATGTGKVGEKATGTMRISRSGVSDSDTTIPSGTGFSSGDYTFVTTQDAVVPRSQIMGSSLSNGSVSNVPVQAVAVGSEYNLAAQGYQSSRQGFSGQGSAMTGGSSREVRVVSAEDIERAQGQLIGQSTDEEKKALVAKFTNGEKVIDSSFTVDRAAAVATPAAGGEATNGKGSLTIPTTYTIQAVSTTNLDTYLKASLQSKIDAASQKIYSTGIDKATINNFRRDGQTLLATVNASGSVGPKIDEAAIKDQVKGKIYGEVQQSLESIDGVKDVDVKFSYFWVRTVPSDVNKIRIEFKVENE